MAIQMARAYTGNFDVIIFEESFHGGLSTGAEMSAKVLNICYLPTPSCKRYKLKSIYFSFIMGNTSRRVQN